MKVTIGGQYQGETDQKTAIEKQGKFPDTVIRARCVCCGNPQEIKKPSDECKSCGMIGNWK